MALLEYAHDLEDFEVRPTNKIESAIQVSVTYDVYRKAYSMFWGSELSPTLITRKDTLKLVAEWLHNETGGNTDDILNQLKEEL